MQIQPGSTGEVGHLKESVTVDDDSREAWHKLLS